MVLLQYPGDAGQKQSFLELSCQQMTQFWALPFWLLSSIYLVDSEAFT